MTAFLSRWWPLLAGAVLLSNCQRTLHPTAALPGLPADTIQVGGLIPRDSTGQALDTPKAAGPHGAPPAWGADASAGRARLFGLFGKKASPPPNPSPLGVGGKCKGCTFYYGTANVNTAGKNAVAGAGATGGGKGGAPVAGTGGVAIEKAKAPVATGTGDATDQAGTGVASTIKGNGNAPVLTNTPVEALGWQAQLAKSIATPVGLVVAVLLLAAVGYGVYRFWPVLVRRKSNDTASS